MLLTYCWYLVMRHVTCLHLGMIVICPDLFSPTVVPMALFDMPFAGVIAGLISYILCSFIRKGLDWLSDRTNGAFGRHAIKENIEGPKMEERTNHLKPHRMEKAASGFDPNYEVCATVILHVSQLIGKSTSAPVDFPILVARTPSSWLIAHRSFITSGLELQDLPAVYPSHGTCGVLQRMRQC